jgi:hypothetical protein
MKEGWVEFTRIPCKIGFVDKWVGDSGSNPNYPQASNFSLNSFNTWFRLNGKGKWIDKSQFRFNFYNTLTFERGLYNAEDLWEECINEENG